ncbi:polysaccharide deacetylase family protein [Marinobacter daepoensis]|uniref:polysaccharide deacetylase family protein n=1 Tax=Marinobacter daepoensis TaxID=262077 RepID=UPI00056536E1|nr:polysaccharide deacetylase family protein [Marinobacter daepoensis]
MLERQFSYLKENFDVLSLSDALSECDSPISKKKPIVSLTIDDGYRDFYEFCFPLLKKYEFPATFYVATDFVGQGIWLWHDKLKWIIDSNSVISESLYIKEHKYTPEYWCNNKDTLWRDLVSVMLRMSGEEIENILDKLSFLTKAKIPESPTADYCSVSWAELREMQAARVSIGGHTKSHYSLGHLSVGDVKSQVLGCRDHLSHELGEQSRHFCFPNGQPADITGSAKAMVKSAGFESAVAAYYDKSGVTDRFSMSRHGVGESWFEFQKSVWGIDRLGAQLFNRNSTFDWGEVCPQK